MRLAVFLTYILYCFYIGVLLIFLPWSPLWEANGLSRLYPALAAVANAGSTRGAVSALGVVLLAVGTVDAVRFIRLGGHEER